MKFLKIAACSLLLLPVFSEARTINYGGKIVDLCDARVFNAQYYKARYADLAGLNDAGLCEHFSVTGIPQNRQAHSTFWAYEYINIYADLVTALGPNNYQAGIGHYLAQGIADGRIADVLVPPIYVEADYRALNRDLPSNMTSDALKQHFITTGAAQNRQAGRAFSGYHYLLLNPDVANAYNNKVLYGLSHYMRFGAKEKRPTLVDNVNLLKPANNIGTISDGSVSIGFSKWVAGAITSVKYGGKEFINNFDHGRSLSYAWQYNNKGECDNPTENGSRKDGYADGTSSKLNSAVINGNTFTSSNNAAFWMAPGETSNTCPSGVKNTNTTFFTEDVLQKTVTLNPYGPNTFSMEASLTLKQAYPVVQMEAPSLYLNEDFSSYYYFDYVSKTVKPLAVPGSNNGLATGPAIFATSDGAYAIAIITEGNKTLNSVTGLPFYVGQSFYVPTNRADSTRKFSSVVTSINAPKGYVVKAKSYVVVGNLSSVSAKVAEISNALLASNKNAPMALAARFNSSVYFQLHSAALAGVSENELFRHCLQHGYRSQWQGCYNLIN